MLFLGFWLSAVTCRGSAAGEFSPNQGKHRIRISRIGSIELSHSRRASVQMQIRHLASQSVVNIQTDFCQQADLLQSLWLNLQSKAFLLVYLKELLRDKSGVVLP